MQVSLNMAHVYVVGLLGIPSLLEKPNTRVIQIIYRLFSTTGSKRSTTYTIHIRRISAMYFSVGDLYTNPLRVCQWL